MKAKFTFLLSIILFFYSRLIFPQQPTLIDSLKNLLKTAASDSNKINLLLSLSDHYKILNEDSALYFARSVQILAENSDDHLLMLHSAYHLMGIGVYYRAHKYFDPAEKFFFIAKDLREKAGNEFYQIGTYVNLCINYYFKQEYDEGIKVGIKARDIAIKYISSADSITKQDALIELGDSYYFLGQIYYEKGEYNNAIMNYTKSLKYRDLIQDDRRKAQSLSGLAMIFVVQKNYQKALEYFTKSLSYFKEEKTAKGIGMVLRYIGNIYEAQNNYSEALNYYQNSLSVQYENRSYFDRNVTYQIIGNLYVKLFSLPVEKIYEVIPSFSKYGIEETKSLLVDSATTYLNKAFEKSKQTGDDLIMIKSLLGLADVSIQMNDFDTALIHLNEALSLAKKLSSNAELLECYLALSSISEKLGHYEDAYNYQKQYSSLKDTVLNENNSKLITDLQVKYETEEKDKEITLLNKDNEIKSLQLKQQQAVLLASRLETKNEKNQLLLVNNSMEIQRLKLAKTQRDLQHQQEEVRVNKAELEILNKDEKLQEQRLKKQKYLRNGLLTIALLLIIVGLLLFRGFQLRKKLERQEAIAQERKRISSDLHDDIGAGLTWITLLSETAIKESKTPELTNVVNKISTITQELSTNISEIIWTLNSNNDFLENMVSYIRRYAAEYFENSSVKLIIITPDNIAKTSISGKYRRNIFYTVKEALHNIIKHSEATEAELRFMLKNNVLSVIISDNGKGIPQGSLNRFGNGLNNMRSRIKSIMGDFTIEGNNGTKITLSLNV